MENGGDVMKKQTLTQGTMILIVTGFIIKVLGMINRIIVTRLLGVAGVGIYMLITPTLMLLATFASIGLPVAIPTLISRANSRQKKILSASLIIAMLSSFIISLILFAAARPLAFTFLKDERTYLPLLSIGPLLFCIAFSTILKAYFQGEQNMMPTAVATLTEQIVRMIACITLIGLMLPRGVVYGVVAVMWASIAGEIASSLILVAMFFKNLKVNHRGATLKPVRLSSQNFKDVLAISFPTTGSRLIGAFTHFLEPIIVVGALYRIGYSSEISGKLYGAVSGFTLPVLLMPSFITVAITQSIVPSISKAYIEQDFALISRHLNISFSLSFLMSGLYTVLIMTFPNEIMHLLYHTETGANFLIMMAPFFLLLYFQAPLTAALQAIDEAKSAMRSSLISSMIKISLMVVLLQIPSINIHGLMIAILTHIVILTGWHYLHLRKKIGYQIKLSTIVNGLLILGITYLVGLYLKANLALFAHQLLNMGMITLIISFIYLIGLAICGLLPKWRFRK